MRAIWPTVTVVAAFALALAAIRYPGARTVLLGLAVWAGLGTFVAIGWAIGRRSGWPGLDEGELLLQVQESRPLVHQTPPHDAVPQVTPCCSVPLLELPPGSHFSSEPSERTCGGGS